MGNLLIGDKLISVNGDDLIIEDYYMELTEEPVSVYNFQVEDFHTYFVGDCAVWVHNAECTIEFNNKSGLDEKEFKQQLSDQQDGFGDLTIDEYKKIEQHMKVGKLLPETEEILIVQNTKHKLEKKLSKLKQRNFEIKGTQKVKQKLWLKNGQKEKLHYMDQTKSLVEELITYLAWEIVILILL